MQVSHLGHATVLVATSRTQILIDPGGLSSGWHDLTDLDVIAITHQHADHLDRTRLGGLLASNPDALLVTDADTARQLRDHDVAAEVLTPGEQLRSQDVTVTAVGGRHAIIHADIPRIGNVGLIIEQDDGARILHPGDALDAIPKGIDVLALPINAPWASLSQTIEFTGAVDAPHVIPIHDALLSEAGRGIYLRLLGELTHDGITPTDLSDGTRLTL